MSTETFDPNQTVSMTDAARKFFASKLKVQSEGADAVISKQQGTVNIHKGDKVRLTALPEKLHLFNQDQQSYRCL